MCLCTASVKEKERILLFRLGQSRIGLARVPSFHCRSYVIYLLNPTLMPSSMNMCIGFNWLYTNRDVVDLSSHPLHRLGHSPDSNPSQTSLTD